MPRTSRDLSHKNSPDRDLPPKNPSSDNKLPQTPRKKRNRSNSIDSNVSTDSEFEFTPKNNQKRREDFQKNERGATSIEASNIKNSLQKISNSLPEGNFEKITVSEDKISVYFTSDTNYKYIIQSYQDFESNQKFSANFKAQIQTPAISSNHQTILEISIKKQENSLNEKLEKPDIISRFIAVTEDKQKNLVQNEEVESGFPLFSPPLNIKRRNKDQNLNPQNSNSLKNRQNLGEKNKNLLSLDISPIGFASPTPRFSNKNTESSINFQIPTPKNRLRANSVPVPESKGAINRKMVRSSSLPEIEFLKSSKFQDVAPTIDNTIKSPTSLQARPYSADNVKSSPEKLRMTDTSFNAIKQYIKLRNDEEDLAKDEKEEIKKDYLKKFIAAIEKERENPKPENVYRGVGLNVDIKEIDNKKILFIKDIFSPEIDRFFDSKNNKIQNSSLKEKFITQVRINGKWQDINELFLNCSESEGIKNITRFFHDDKKIEFKTSDNCEYSCNNKCNETAIFAKKGSSYSCLSKMEEKEEMAIIKRTIDVATSIKPATNLKNPRSESLVSRQLNFNLPD